ncbi:hypothetical protein JCM17092_27800 [Haloplanus litoreus]
MPPRHNRTWSHDMQDVPFPRKFGAKIHPSHHVHQRLYEHNPNPVPFVACKVHRSSWFVNNPRKEFLSPEQDLFLMTYEHDRHIIGRDTVDVVDRFEELDGVAQGAFAGDRLTYGSMNRREVVKEIDESVQRQLTAHELMEERSINMPLYPSIMGWEDWHFERCRILVDEISRWVGFDATQYDSEYEFAKHVKRLDEILEPKGIFVNGCVSPKWLRMLPKSVVACSGSYNIREETEDATGTPQRDNLPEVVEKRVDALNNWQSELTNYL